MRLDVLILIAVAGAVAASLGVAAIYCGLEPAARAALLSEIAKGLIAFALTTLAGALIGLFVQLHLAWRAKQASLLQLQEASVKRLVAVANTLRRVPAILAAKSDRETANQQLLAVVDARLELHLLSHEADAFGGSGTNVLFSGWMPRASWTTGIKQSIGKMQDYLRRLEEELRSGAANSERLPLLTDLLKPGADVLETASFYTDFIVAYRDALTGMQLDIASRRRAF